MTVFNHVSRINVSLPMTISSRSPIGSASELRSASFVKRGKRLGREREVDHETIPKLKYEWMWQ